MWSAGAAAAAGAAVGAMTWAVRGRSSTVFAPSIWHGDRRRRQVALTFDDGPSEQTPELLDLLDAHGVKATFFACGRNVERLPHVAADVVRRGHEIANHSWSHRRLDFASLALMREEIGRAQEAITGIAGAAPRLYRPPYGVRWFGLGRVQREHGLMGMLWTTLGRDWKLSPAEIRARVLGRLRAGDILCLHDGRELRFDPDIGTTIEAVRQIIPDILGQNLAFVKGSAMLEP